MPKAVGAQEKEMTISNEDPGNLTKEVTFELELKRGESFAGLCGLMAGWQRDIPEVMY